MESMMDNQKVSLMVSRTGILIGLAMVEAKA